MYKNEIIAKKESIKQFKMAINRLERAKDILYTYGIIDEFNKIDNSIMQIKNVINILEKNYE